MASYQFTVNDEGFSNCTHVPGEGHPAGCIEHTAPGGSADLGSLSIPIADGEPISCWVRFVIDEAGSADYSLEFWMTAGDETDRLTYGASNISSYDSGWVKLSALFGGSGTVESIALHYDTGVQGSPATHVYFDSIYVAEAEPGGYELTHSAGGVPGGVMI